MRKFKLFVVPQAERPKTLGATNELKGVLTSLGKHMTAYEKSKAA